MTNNKKTPVLNNKEETKIVDENIIEAELVSTDIVLTSNPLVSQDISSMAVTLSNSNPLGLLKTQFDLYQGMIHWKGKREKLKSELILENRKLTSSALESSYEKAKNISQTDNLDRTCMRLNNRNLDKCVKSAEENPRYKEVLNVCNQLDNLVAIFAITYDPIKFNKKIQHNNFFLRGNYFHASAFVDIKNGVSNCETDTKKHEFITVSDIIRLVMSGIVFFKYKKDYIFRANGFCEEEVLPNITSLRNKIKNTLMDDVFYNKIKSLINNNFILTVQEEKLFPNNKMEFFLEPNTFRLIRNTYILLNQIEAGIENADCSSILSFLLNQMKNDQKSFTYLIYQLAYAIQTGKPSDITIILYGKFGKGVAILFDLILSLLFRPSQSISIGKNEFKNLDETCKNNILCYVGCNLHDLDDNDEFIESQIDKLISESNDFNFVIINTETIGYIDIVNDLDGLAIIEVDNSLINFESLNGKPMKTIKRVFIAEIEPFRAYLMGLDLSGFDPNKALDNEIKNKLKKPPTPLINFIENIKLGKIEYIEQALERVEEKLKLKFDDESSTLEYKKLKEICQKTIDGFTKKNRYIIKSSIHPLFCFCENEKIRKSVFSTLIENEDRVFFSKENIKKHDGEVYIIDSELNDMATKSLTTV